MSESKVKEHNDRGKERDKEAQTCWTILLKRQQLQQHLTRLQESINMLTYLRNCPFQYLQNSLNLECPRDNVNAVITYPYLTLPYNGSIQRKIGKRGKQEIQILIQLCWTSRFCFSWRSPKMEDSIGRGWKSYIRASKSRCWLSETILNVHL